MENFTPTLLPPLTEGAQPPDNILPIPNPLLEYATAKQRIDKYITDWGADCVEVAQRRKERYLDIDVERLRQAGDIQEDETFIPDRVIDSNINRDSADTLGFLNAGFRLAVFDCLSDPSLDVRQQEIEFTKGLTYDGWYPEFAAWEDGAQLHGMSYIEVTFDPKKPLHVGFDYIAFDKLFYNRGVSNIQQSEMLVRKYCVNVFVLETWAKKYGFDPVQIQNILASNQEKQRDRDLDVFRVYIKTDGVVYVAWYSKLAEAADWLKKPQVLFTGIVSKQDNNQQVPLEDYPIYTRLYKPDENEILVEHKGRGFLDLPQQEANTAIITSYINNLMRSSNFYASPKQQDDSSSEMKELDINLSPGAVMSQPLDFWSLPAPDVTTLQAINFFDSRQAAMNGKTAFTVVNRKDSRKTKKELDLAEGQEAKITNTTLANFSATLRSVLSFAWRIVQSQAIIQQIRFLQIPAPSGQGMINNVQIIALDYDLRPAGETDIIEAEAEVAKIQQDWPILSTTPMAGQLLEYYLKLRYPHKADEFIQAIKTGNHTQAKQLVGALGSALTGAIKPEELQDLKLHNPQQYQQLQQLQQQAQQFLQSPNMV